MLVLDEYIVLELSRGGTDGPEVFGPPRRSRRIPVGGAIVVSHNNRDEDLPGSFYRVRRDR